MPDPVPATSIIEKLPILELAKVGFLGLACLIFVLAAIVLTTYLVRRNASDAANNLIKTFLSFGTVAIVIAAISQFATLFVNPHSSYQVSMQFSPDMQTNGLPYPRVVMHAKPIKLDEPFALGEVRFHLGWTFHRAGPNRSTIPRSVMTVIYMDRDMRLQAPANKMQQADWERWCPGAKIGEIIATPKNPVLFERT